jgi:hypothetical protein
MLKVDEYLAPIEPVSSQRSGEIKAIAGNTPAGMRRPFASKLVTPFQRANLNPEL